MIHDPLWKAIFLTPRQRFACSPYLVFKRATMRKLLLLCCALSSGLLFAQNWALINPDYKYNYSNDGTDTISNQIFVTHVDTLGVDSFGYKLNRIALVCDTCSNPNLSYFFWPDAPQWLGGEVDVSNDVWHFKTGASRVILPLAAPGDTWLFDTLNNVLAQMGPTVAATTFGLADEHRSITLSNGEALELSRDHGILTWDSGHHLIGINGPQLGRTIPTLPEFFPYVANDVLEYSVGYGGCDGVGGCDGRTREFKFTVGAGVISDSAILFSGWMVAHYLWSFNIGGPGSYVQEVHDYMNSAGQWNPGLPELPWSELLFSYPGQLVKRQSFLVPQFSAPNYCIAEHGLDSAGRYVIGCRSMPSPFSTGSEGHFLYGGNQPGPYGTSEMSGPEDYCDAGQTECGVNYTEGIGLVGFYGNYFERSEHYFLNGAVLGGDTIGTITPDDVLLGVNDNKMVDRRVFPNPASDHLQLSSDTPGTVCTILNTTGQVLLTHTTSSSAERIDVSGLSTGFYLLRVNDRQEQRTQPFIIAR